MDEVAARDSWSMLVAATSTNGRVERLSKLHVLETLARRSLPSVVEATVIPAALFYVCLVFVGPAVAMMSALLWSYGSVVRRLVGGRRIPAILSLAVLGLTVRTAVGILSGTFIYFLQPILTTLVLAGVFLGSLCYGQPVVARLARDFCPLSREIASRPAIVRLFGGLTMLWAGVHLVTAGATFALLMSVSTPNFVLLKSVFSLGVTIGAIVITVSWSIRTARAENLVLARVAV